MPYNLAQWGLFVLRRIGFLSSLLWISLNTAAFGADVEALQYFDLAEIFANPDTSGHFKIGDKGAAQEPIKLAELSSKPVEPGDPEAQYNLGVLYANGNGVEQDYLEAAKWYRLSADQGCERAQVNLEGLYKNGHVARPIE